MNNHEIIEKIISRRSYKKFDPTKKIPDEIWANILKAAQFSPSSFGIEPWKIIEVKSIEHRNALKPIISGAYKPEIDFHQLETADKFLILLARTQQNAWFGSAYLENHFLNTKHLPKELLQQRLQFMQDWVSQTDPELNNDPAKFLAYAKEQVHILLNQILLSATLLGVDSCPIGGFNKPELHKFLVDNKVYQEGEFEPAVTVALGYRVADVAYPNTRNELSNIHQVI